MCSGMAVGIGGAAMVAAGAVVVALLLLPTAGLQFVVVWIFLYLVS